MGNRFIFEVFVTGDRLAQLTINVIRLCKKPKQQELPPAVRWERSPNADDGRPYILKKGGNLVTIGKTIAYTRNKSGLSQKGLAEKISCDQSTIAKIESGVREPKAAMVIAIAEALGCTPNDLLGYEKGDE